MNEEIDYLCRAFRNPDPSLALVYENLILNVLLAYECSSFN